MRKHGRKINFSAGPCTLDVTVLEAIRDKMLNYEDEGLSVLEMSHRSKAYISIHKECQALIKELMHLDDNWTVLLLPGGASMQFEMIPMNLLNGKKGAYCISGHFSKKAYSAAKEIYGDQVYICSDSSENNFTKIEDPKNWKIDEKNTAYVHLTTNNTVYGLALRDKFPKLSIPVIADMSSNILSEEFDYSVFDMIYAGAQKNLGCAGLAIVAIKNSLLEKSKVDKVPKMLSYEAHAAADSEYNTPPSFPIYVAMENLRWVKKMGIKAIASRNLEKAELLYSYIDSSDFYSNSVCKENRSLMNIIFRTPSDELDKKFSKEAAKEDILSISGYGKVGGLRASVYNAMDLSQVEELIVFMKKFEQLNK